MPRLLPFSGNLMWPVLGEVMQDPIWPCGGKGHKVTSPNPATWGEGAWLRSNLATQEGEGMAQPCRKEHWVWTYCNPDMHWGGGGRGHSLLQSGPTGLAKFADGEG